MLLRKFVIKFNRERGGGHENFSEEMEGLLKIVIIKKNIFRPRNRH